MSSVPFVAFVHPRAATWRDWTLQECSPDPDEAPERFLMGRDQAPTQVFFRLKRRGHNVVLAERLPPGALPDCLDRLVADDELAAAVSREARAAALRVFDWEACVDHVLACRRHKESVCSH